MGIDSIKHNATHTHTRIPVEFLSPTKPAGDVLYLSCHNPATHRKINVSYSELLSASAWSLFKHAWAKIHGETAIHLLLMSKHSALGMACSRIGSSGSSISSCRCPCNLPNAVDEWVLKIYSRSNVLRLSPTTTVERSESNWNFQLPHQTKLSLASLSSGATGKLRKHETKSTSGHLAQLLLLGGGGGGGYWYCYCSYVDAVAVVVLYVWGLSRGLFQRPPWKQGVLPWTHHHRALLQSCSGKCCIVCIDLRHVSDDVYVFAWQCIFVVWFHVFGVWGKL